MSELPVRQPAVAGQFYPGNSDVLRKDIQKYVDEATLPEDLGTVHAVVAPHAGYIYSGPTAGYAFKALTTLPQKPWTVYLLGPAHRVPFRGVALGEFSAFQTPLGDAHIAVEQVAELSDVEPREMPFHLSAQAKLLKLQRHPVRSWLLGQCPLNVLRSDGLAEEYVRR